MSIIISILNTKINNGIKIILLYLMTVIQLCYHFYLQNLVMLSTNQITPFYWPWLLCVIFSKSPPCSIFTQCRETSCFPGSFCGFCTVESSQLHWLTCDIFHLLLGVFFSFLHSPYIFCSETYFQILIGNLNLDFCHLSHIHHVLQNASILMQPIFFYSCFDLRQTFLSP